MYRELNVAKDASIMLTRQLECAFCCMLVPSHQILPTPSSTSSADTVLTCPHKHAVTQHELDLCTAKADTERELLAEKADNEQKALQSSFQWERRSLEVKVRA